MKINKKRGVDIDNINRKDLGVYIHIPFCQNKCAYCDFLSAPADETIQRKYMDALLSEIRSYKNKTAKYQVATIFIGGGTPSIVDSSYISGILYEIKNIFLIKEEAEITIEVNPGTVNSDKLNDYKAAGINRLSFGLQTVQDEELKVLGRSHSYKQFYDNYILARKIGFSNINIDLISALPKQDELSWEETLRTVSQLEPEHISSYSLIIEEGTPFYNLYSKGKELSNQLPDEETDRLIYQSTEKILEEYSYHRYEISNYAKTGFECRHNYSYWTGTEYLGLGLGSASLLQNVRFSNEANLGKYITLLQSKGKESSDIMTDTFELRRDIIKLSKKQQMEEFMFLGLRTYEGISKKEFKERFNRDIKEIYGKAIDDLSENNLLINKGNRVYLTDYGTDISNYTLSHFILD